MLRSVLFEDESAKQEFLHGSSHVPWHEESRAALKALQSLGFPIMLTLDELEEVLSRNPGFAPANNASTRLEKLVGGEYPDFDDVAAAHAPMVRSICWSVAGLCPDCIVRSPNYAFAAGRYIASASRFLDVHRAPDSAPSQVSWMASEGGAGLQYFSCIDPRLAESKLVCVRYKGQLRLLSIDKEGFIVDGRQRIDVGRQRVWHAPDPVKIRCAHTSIAGNARSSKSLVVPLDVQQAGGDGAW